MERRRSPRRLPHRRATFEHEGAVVDTLTIDISAEGAGLVIYRPTWTRAPRAGQQLELEFGGLDEALAVSAKVVWVDAVTGGRRMGVHFLCPLNDQQLDLLAAEES